MAYSCYICGSGRDKIQHISLHQFPEAGKNDDLLAKWLVACKLSKHDNVHGVRVCSLHFRKEDVSIGRFNRVNPDAVPCLNLEKTEVRTRTQYITKWILSEHDYSKPESDKEKSGESNKNKPSLAHPQSLTKLQQTVEKLATAEKCSFSVQHINNQDDLKKWIKYIEKFVEAGIPLSTAIVTDQTDLKLSEDELCTESTPLVEETSRTATLDPEVPATTLPSSKIETNSLEDCDENNTDTSSLPKLQRLSKFTKLFNKKTVQQIKQAMRKKWSSQNRKRFRNKVLLSNSSRKNC